MSNWKPGDVVLVTTGANERKVGLAGRNCIALFGDEYDEEGGIGVLAYGQTSARPLVVIDPEDREQVLQLASAYVQTWSGSCPPNPETANICARQMKAALRAVLLPPKDARPAEPNTWGVVEASCVHSTERRKWILHDDGNWWPAEQYGRAVKRVRSGLDPRLPDDWDSLIDPVIVREGVPS